MAQDAVGGGVKEQLLRDMESSYAELMGVVRALPVLEASRDKTWGPFEVLSHIVGWHLFSARRLNQIERGEEPISPGPDDQMNEGFVEERAGLTREVLVRELDKSFEELKAAVRNVDAAEFWLGGPGEESSLAHFIASANGPEHYAEHLPDLATR